LSQDLRRALTRRGLRVVTRAGCGLARVQCEAAGKQQSLGTTNLVKFHLAASVRLAAAALLVCALTVEAASFAVDSNPTALAREKVAGASDASFETFLDRLMQAESGGRELAANPRSTALGPFQFIKDTFLYVTRRYFAAEVANLTEEQVLALRTNRAFSRRAVSAYLREIAAFLGDKGFEPTFAHLRLSYLVGPNAAAKVMAASPETTLSEVLAPGALKANPFMANMTAANLIARAARDVSREDDGSDLTAGPRVRTAAEGPGLREAPRPHVRGTEKPKCKESLASCRKFISLRSQKARSAESRGPEKDNPKKKRQTS
jgi:hypothetical protein